MKILYALPTLFLLHLGIVSNAQIGTPGFAEYLIQQGAYRDVLDLKEFHSPSLTSQQKDSLDFYTGWAHFHMQQLPEAINQFQAVSSGSGFFKQSRVFSSWCNLYQGNIPAAKNDLYLPSGSLLSSNDAFQFQQAAISLIERDFDQASVILTGLQQDETRYQAQTDQLQYLLQRGMNYSSKSKALAAILSTIIPGSGKIYAGETGAGISSFFLLAGLGGMAAENIIKTGWVSWNSLIFTGLFGVFYIGNIYGSMISVQTYRNRMNENYVQGILATAVIPLRDYYR